MTHIPAYFALLIRAPEANALFWSAVAFHVVLFVVAIWLLVWFVRRVNQMSQSLTSIDEKLSEFLDKNQ